MSGPMCFSRIPLAVLIDQFGSLLRSLFIMLTNISVFVINGVLNKAMTSITKSVHLKYIVCYLKRNEYVCENHALENKANVM